MTNHARNLGNLLAAMAFVAAGMFLVLKVGFVIHNDPQPAVIASNSLTTAASLVVFATAVAATVLAIKALGRKSNSERVRRDMKQAHSAQMEARRRRVAELAADPKRAKYAPLVDRGEDWSDEDIAYFETPGITVTCEHLQPIERSMRDDGIDVRLYTYKRQDVLAKCRIDFATLERDSSIPPPVRYAEFYAAERYEFEHPTAFLICDDHKSMIHTLHPEEAGANDAPWFPAPAG